jgi:hypothetical protein
MALNGFGHGGSALVQEYTSAKFKIKMAYSVMINAGRTNLESVENIHAITKTESIDEGKDEC